MPIDLDPKQRKLVDKLSGKLGLLAGEELLFATRVKKGSGSKAFLMFGALGVIAHTAATRASDAPKGSMAREFGRATGGAEDQLLCITDQRLVVAQEVAFGIVRNVAKGTVARDAVAHVWHHAGGPDPEVLVQFRDGTTAALRLKALADGPALVQATQLVWGPYPTPPPPAPPPVG